MNFITGGAAKVEISFPAIVFPTMPIAVKIQIQATDDFVCTGVYVDVDGAENLSFRPANATADVSSSASTFRQAFSVGPGFALKKGETRELTGVVTLPKEAQPTYIGKHGKHTWTIQARLEAKGNDPDSGWKVVKVGCTM
jgi:hypothetical protein